MTDKQIIIDECIHLDEWKHCDICEKLIKTKDGANGKKREHLLTEEDLRCDFYPNCHYKQLKRKEQECEELKAKFELFKTSNQTTIDQLKAENETLFKAIEEVNKINKRLESENEDLKKSILQECPNCGEEYLNYKGAALYFENSDLKQTLTEIKEIAEANKNYKFKIPEISCAGDTLELKFDVLEQILQKINEVEE